MLPLRPILLSASLRSRRQHNMGYFCDMEQIGIRELRQHASTWIRKVKAGASIQIAERGRPVALLVPIDPVDPDREQLIESGALVPAPEPRHAFAVSDLTEGPSPTGVLDEQRSDRRST